MLEGYFDETGIHDGAAVCIVAGYYAQRSQWNKYESAWKKILRRERIREFHAKVFFGAAPKGSEYYEWSATRRKWYIHDLLETITANELHAVGAGVIIADWERLGLEQRKFLTGAEYSPKRRKFESSPQADAPINPTFSRFKTASRKWQGAAQREKRLISSST
jgi:hypothetical protein